MKNWLTRIAALVLTATALASCDKDENKVTMQPSNSITLNASTTSTVLQQINASSTAVTYTWSAVQFSLSGTEYTKTPTITYQLQVSKTADGFGYVGASTIDAGTSLTRAVTVDELNNILNAIGFATNTPATAYVRVVAMVGSDSHTFASAPVALTATAYPACVAPNADTWALVGPAGLGWPSGTTATEDGIPMTWNCALQAYTVRTTLSAGAFKFRQNKKWDINLGGPAGNLAQGIVLAKNGSDLNLATPGTYTVKLTVTGSGTGVTAGMVTVTP